GGAGVDCRIEDAVIGGEAAERYPGEAAFAQIAGEAGRRLAVVFPKRRIRVDRRVIALADHELDPRDSEAGMECRPFGALHAMIRPQRLRSVIELDRVE